MLCMVFLKPQLVDPHRIVLLIPEQPFEILYTVYFQSDLKHENEVGLCL